MGSKNITINLMLRNRESSCEFHMMLVKAICGFSPYVGLGHIV